MTLRSWLEWSFIKEGLKNLFWNFHYLVLFGIITLLSVMGIVTFGCGIMALASSTRLIANDEKIGVSYYFSEFKRLFVPGVILSIIILTFLASLWSSFAILSSDTIAIQKYIAYIAISIITVLSFFLFYYPFAGFKENRVFVIMRNSFVYTLGHLWDTVVHISIVYILWRILSFSPPILAIMFLPFSFFIVNRFIIANNRSIDYKKSKPAQ